MLTHGPPKDILDETHTGEKVGCEHLRRGVSRCKPRLHCFGHIHESWGAGRLDWVTQAFQQEKPAKSQVMAERCARIDVSEAGSTPLKWGQETLFVNASIMNLHHQPANAPWIVDLDLPAKDDAV